MTSITSNVSWWVETARRTRAINEANGFDRPTKENLLSKLMLLITEVDEAAHAHSPQNWIEELADIAIRDMDILEAIWPGNWNVRDFLSMAFADDMTRRDRLWCVIHNACQAAEYARKADWDGVVVCLEYVLRDVRYVASTGQDGASLISAIDDKLKKNAQRGHLHGKASSA